MSENSGYRSAEDEKVAEQLVEEEEAFSDAVDGTYQDEHDTASFSSTVAIESPERHGEALAASEERDMRNSKLERVRSRKGHHSRSRRRQPKRHLPRKTPSATSSSSSSGSDTESDDTVSYSEEESSSTDGERGAGKRHRNRSPRSHRKHSLREKRKHASKRARSSRRHKDNLLAPKERVNAVIELPTMRDLFMYVVISIGVLAFLAHLATTTEDVSAVVKQFWEMPVIQGIMGKQVDRQEASLALLYSPEVSAMDKDGLTLGMLADDRSVRDFVGGYTALYVTCRHALLRLGEFPSTAADAPSHHGNDMRAMLGGLSADETRPYFCANHLFDNIKTDSGEQRDAFRKRRREAWESLRRSTESMPSNPNEIVEHMLTALYYGYSAHADGATAVDAQSPNAQIVRNEDPRSQIGYTTHMFFARDPKPFSAPAKHEKHDVFAVPYEDVVSIGVDLVEGHHDCVLRQTLDEKQRRKHDGDAASRQDTQVALRQTSTSCVCGPHLGMARSIAIASTEQKASVFIEPDIYSLEFDTGADDGHAIVMEPQHMQHGCGVPNWLIHADAGLRTHLNMTIDGSQPGSARLHFAPSVVVQYIPLRRDPHSAKLVADQAVTLKRVSGYEAKCVQYCSILASKLNSLGRQAYNKQTLV